MAHTIVAEKNKGDAQFGECTEWSVLLLLPRLNAGFLMIRLI